MFVINFCVKHFNLGVKFTNNIFVFFLDARDGFIGIILDSFKFRLDAIKVFVYVLNRSGSRLGFEVRLEPTPCKKPINTKGSAYNPVVRVADKVENCFLHDDYTLH